MEPITEKPEEEQTPRPSQSGVMDITPPSQNASSPQATTETPVAAAPELAQEDDDTTEQPNTPDANQSDEATEAAPAPLAATPVPQSSGHKTPIVAIVLAVLVAACLATFAVLTYMKSNPSEQPKTDQQSPTVQTENKATEADVDNLVNEIDESLNSANDATDFDDGSINDTSLGL